MSLEAPGTGLGTRPAELLHQLILLPDAASQAQRHVHLWPSLLIPIEENTPHFQPEQHQGLEVIPQQPRLLHCLAGAMG